MYEHLVYDDFGHGAGAGRARLYDRTLTVNGVPRPLHDGLAHRLCRRTRAADQGDGDDPVTVDLEPDRGPQWAAVEALNGLRTSCRTMPSHERRDLCVSMSTRRAASSVRSRRAFYVYPSRADHGPDGPSGKLPPTRFRHRVAGGRGRGGGAELRSVSVRLAFYATKTEDGRRPAAHPALRQPEMNSGSDSKARIKGQAGAGDVGSVTLGVVRRRWPPPCAFLRTSI